MQPDHRKLLAVSAPVSGEAIALPPITFDRAARRQNFKAPWLREHDRIVHRICQGVARWIESGVSQRKAVRWFAERNKNRFYKCDPSRPILLSRKTITRDFYRWKAGGRTPQAVALRYGKSSLSLSKAEAAAFARACLAPGQVSMLAAYRGLSNPARTYETCRAALTPKMRAVLRAVHLGRIRQAARERHAVRLTETLEENAP